jgi:hypothetical protein
VDRQEQLQAIKELLQSRGWGLFLDLSDKWRKQKSKEQAEILRRCDAEEGRKAIYIQGQLDGSAYIVMKLAEDFINQNAPIEGENPVY